MRVKVSREAAIELEEAGLGERLLNAFEKAVQRLEGPIPPLSPVPGEAAQAGAKRIILHKFPFSLVTIQRDKTIDIVAFAHHSRKPRYWRGRIRQ